MNQRFSFVADARGLAALVLVATTLVACTGGSSSSSDSTAAPMVSGGSPAPGTTSPVGPPASSGSSGAASSPVGSPSNIDQPAATAPVIRNGKTPSPSVTAAPAPLRQGRAVVYPDGVRLQITSIRQGTVKADGSKVIAGPKTTFALTFTNGSGRAVALDQVVVSAGYGARNLAARPVYDDTDQSPRDFAGTVKPGGSTTAVYAFGIPTDQLSRVTVRVDFDAIHVAARFTGRVQVR